MKKQTIILISSAAALVGLGTYLYFHNKKKADVPVVPEPVVSTPVVPKTFAITQKDITIPSIKNTGIFFRSPQPLIDQSNLAIRYNSEAQNSTVAGLNIF